MTTKSLSVSGYKLCVNSVGWVLKIDDGLCLWASSPALYGTINGSVEWICGLTFDHVLVEDLQSELPGWSITGGRLAESSAPSICFAWCLMLAMNADGLSIDLQFELQPGAPAAVMLEHVCLAVVEVNRQEAGVVSTVSRTSPSAGCRAGICKKRCRMKACRASQHSSFLTHGWQSFSFNGVLHGAVPQPRTTMPFFSAPFHSGASLPVGFAAADPNMLVSSMFGLFWLHATSTASADTCNGAGGAVLMGFLSEHKGFGALALQSSSDPCRLLLFSEVGIEIRVNSAESTDRAMVILVPSAVDGTEVAGMHALSTYMQHIALHLQLPQCKPQPTGWCSWYCYGPKVNDVQMHDQLKQLVTMRQCGDLPINLFQLDDGWQSAWGDWLIPNKKFPNGLKPIATAARKGGLLPGLWLAPAACIERSVVAAEHPEWLLRDAFGKPVPCGFTAPGLWLRALDTTHPGVIAHIKHTIRTIVHEWGFGYLKCDFLHCAAMPGARRFNPMVSRAEALHSLMQAVREAAGSATFVLGCGAPIGPCIGLVDAMRVSADTADHWLPRGPNVPGTRWFFAQDQTNLPGARNAVCSTLMRLPMGRVLWNNDPDCLILSDVVPLQQVQALATVAGLSAGSLIFSDFVEKLPEQRLAILKVLLPPLPCVAQCVTLLSAGIPAQAVLDLLPNRDAADLGPWKLVALFNWTDGNAARDIELVIDGKPQKTEEFQGCGLETQWHAFEFWSETYVRLRRSFPNAVARAVPPRCCRLLAIRPVAATSAQLVGSDVHISCGLELAFWQEREAMAPTSRVVEFVLHVGRALRTPRLWLFLPGATVERPPKLCEIAGEECRPCNAPFHVGEEVWLLTLGPVEMDSHELWRVEW